MISFKSLSWYPEITSNLIHRVTDISFNALTSFQNEMILLLMRFLTSLESREESIKQNIPEPAFKSTTHTTSWKKLALKK